MRPLARSVSDDPSDRAPRLALALVLLLAAALRLWAVRHDLPFSYFGDELHFMRRAMAVGTGDLNPHWFHKPAFLMYLLAFCYGLYFLVGRIAGAFHSTAEFGAHFLFNPTLVPGDRPPAGGGLRRRDGLRRLPDRPQGLRQSLGGDRRGHGRRRARADGQLLADDQERRAVRPADGALGLGLPGDPRSPRWAAGGGLAAGRRGHGHPLLRGGAGAGLPGAGGTARFFGSSLEDGDRPLRPRRWCCSGPASSWPPPSTSSTPPGGATPAR